MTMLSALLRRCRKGAADMAGGLVDSPLRSAPHRRRMARYDAATASCAAPPADPITSALRTDDRDHRLSHGELQHDETRTTLQCGIVHDPQTAGLARRRTGPGR